MLAAALLALTACGGSGDGASPDAPSSTPEVGETTPEATHTTAALSCVDQTYASLGDEARLGQLFMIALDTNAPQSALDEAVGAGLGSVIYMSGWDGMEKVRSASEHLQSLVADDGVGLIITADQEGGIVHQLRGDGFTHPPKAIDQASMSPAELTAAATGWGEEMKEAGVNLNLAPVADTVPADIGTRNEPIGKWGRQFGSDPEVVAEYVPAFLRGMQAAGVEGVVKHFPGLGRVTGNTDFTADGIVDDVATVDDPFLEPFVAGMDAGAAMVMMSSAFYPKIDPDHQALFSRTIVTDLLREQLGWDGVVITDDVNTAALASIPVGDRATGFLGSGGDIVLNGDPAALPEMLDAVGAEAAADPDFAAQVEASVHRVLELKDRMGLLPCS